MYNLCKFNKNFKKFKNILQKFVKNFYLEDFEHEFFLKFFSAKC